MTPKELAEKIIQSVKLHCGEGNYDGAIPEIESLLSSALDEAFDKGKCSIGQFVKFDSSLMREIKAKAEAYEECAKIAESLKDKYKDCAVDYHLGSAHMAIDDVPKEIRQRKAEIK